MKNLKYVVAILAVAFVFGSAFTKKSMDSFKLNEVRNATGDDKIFVVYDSFDDEEYTESCPASSWKCGVDIDLGFATELTAEPPYRVILVEDAFTSNHAELVGAENSKHSVLTPIEP